MSYQVLARKWRPQIFEEVIGQEAITRTLRNAIETGRLHHAYLFSGARGVGKTTTARLLAKALNCQRSDSPNPTPCNTSEADACASCMEIAESRSMDVLEFDAASHTKVEEIREIILEGININPARDRFKVFIIDEVHMLSKSSFNALLKTLEEPPDNVVFVMATTEYHKVPDTITSRCQEFEFHTIPLRKILKRLESIAEAEGVKIAPEALKEIARSGEGSMRDAQSNFDQVISFSGEAIGVEDVSAALGIAGTENLVRTIRSVAERDSTEILKVVDDLMARGHDLRNYCRDLMSYVRDLLVFKIAGDAHGLLDTAILSAEEMKDHAATFLEADLIRFFNSLAETEASLRDAAEPRFVLEVGLVKLAEMRRVVPIEEILKRLAEIEAGGMKAAADGSPDNPPAEPSGSAEQEKKTLDSEIKAEPSAASDFREEDSEEESSRPSDDDGEDIELTEGFSAPEPDFLKERFGDEPEARKASGDGLVIDPDLMPVRLETVESEDLEHVDDPWLDAAYERALAKDGDDASPLSNPGAIVEDLIGNVAAVEEDQRAAPARTGSQDSGPNRAIEIVEEMTRRSDEPVELPELPDDPSKEQLLEYAEKHPLVRHAKRLFRGEIVNVTKK
jgi:DNA polymerase-3 subunit gamma/tau